ncbi:MAG: DUF2924 domain-containing protein [Sphingomonadales bacterium]|nr:DUF2924 domain-containing protein [Sphingomonadales bacterium]
MSKLNDDLAALPDMSAAQLRERWEQMGEGTAPRVPPSLLRALLAQRLQERRHGVLPALVVRELRRLANAGIDAAPPRPRIDLTPGTRLVREWNGKPISVDVLEDGFAYDNRTWRSLSEIARHVTGAHWSGPRFFGLTANGR